MNTYEKCNLIRMHIMKQVACTLEYENWDDKFSREQVRGASEEALKEYGSSINPYDLSQAEMDNLGFGKWDESGLMLFPLWLRKYIAEGTGVRDINGKIYAYQLAKEDNDHRYGAIACGIMPNH